MLSNFIGVVTYFMNGDFWLRSASRTLLKINALSSKRQLELNNSLGMVTKIKSSFLSDDQKGCLVVLGIGSVYSNINKGER